MTDDAPDLKPPERSGPQRRFWLTVGEIVAVAGLGLAGLNYWENHRDREQAAVEAKQQAQKEQAPKPSVLVLRGDVDEGAARVMLQPLKAEQVIQTQRYLFPTPVLGNAKEIAAGRPQIDLAWFESGLRGELKAARKAGAELPKGEAALPVGVVTTYIEGGDTHTDSSLYRVGYQAQPGLLGAVKLHLLGLSLIRRGVGPDLQAAVDAQWKAEVPKAK